MRLLSSLSLVILLARTESFSFVAPSTRYTTWLSSSSPPFRDRARIKHYASATMELLPTYDHDQEKQQRSSDQQLPALKQRMKDSMTRNVNRSSEISEQEETLGPKSAGSKRPNNIRVVHTLQEFKDVVANEREKIVVVRWYASYCR